MNPMKAIFPMPELASVEGRGVDVLMYAVHALILVLFVGWAIFFIVALAKFRRSKNPVVKPVKIHQGISSSIELAVAAVEMLLLFGFSIPFWAEHLNAMPPTKNRQEVRVVAQQFAWNIHYPGRDNTFGRTGINFLDESAVGLDPQDPAGKDDIITMNQLFLPVGKTALVRLSSKDVIHSFGLPQMRVKQDNIPGVSTMVWFTPNKIGQYEIVCAQLCGLGHYRMRGFLTVQPQKDFDVWLHSQEQNI